MTIGKARLNMFLQLLVKVKVATETEVAKYLNISTGQVPYAYRSLVEMGFPVRMRQLRTYRNGGRSFRRFSGGHFRSYYNSVVIYYLG